LSHVSLQLGQRYGYCFLVQWLTDSQKHWPNNLIKTVQSSDMIEPFL